MATNGALPPKPAVLKRIYPWDEYDVTLVMQWLFAQAQKTGFIGTYEDFKQRYGAYIEAQDPQDIYDLIENYNGIYHITPLVGIEQILKTKNKVLNQDIIIEQIPESIIDNHETYSGNYTVIPLPRMDQQLRTENKVMEQNIIIEKIPYHETDNQAGGRTVSIG